MTQIRRHISQLPSVLADRIAAGEVIDRPVSIVKELVENSIDAGADSITVEIRSGGKTYLRVTDNGCGIAAEEAELAFSRHATSKISRIADLDAISTLGFRGEALASIAAVSRTELVTKTEGDRTGTYLLIEGGRIAEHSEKGAPTGTTLVVRDLFYNTPARLKFLKNDNVESAQIIELVSRIALAYPHIRVRLINNGNTLFTTPGKGDRRTAIAVIYDPNLAKKLILAEGEAPGGMKLEAYISPPDITRPNRRNQIFFVNGRYISNKILEESVSESYRERMFEGRFPVAFLFLTVDPAFTDVNIHPNKKEIRFDDEKLVKQFVTGTLRNALEMPEAIPEIHVKMQAPNSRKAETDRLEAGYGGAEVKKPEQKPLFRAESGEEQLDIRKLLRSKRAEEERRLIAAAEAEVQEKKETEYETSGNRKVKEDPKAYGFAPSREKAAAGMFSTDGLEPMGVLFNEYILCTDGKAFYMIDQHAAHERVFYEQLIDSFYNQEKASQVLLEPITLSTAFSAGSQAENWMGFLKDVGFQIEEFGARNYLVREIPAYMDLQEAEDFLADFTEELEKAGSFRDQKRVDRIITRACKSAVKANDRLTEQEIRHLLKDLNACRNPFSCPHGRPTIIRMTHAEIDRLFKR